MKKTEKIIKYFSYGFLAVILLFSFSKNANAVVVSNTAPTNGLIGYWSLDEATGTKAYDYSGNKNTGTYFATSSWADGRLGGAAVFASSTNYINIPYKALFFPTTGFTVSVWVYVNAWPSQSTGIVSNAQFNNGGYQIGLNADGCIQGGVSGNGTTFGFTQTCNTGIKQWIHYVYTSDGTNQWLYKNGSLLNISSSTLPYNNGYALQIGGSSQGGWTGNVFNGKIDEVRIYNRVVSVTEVTSLYNAKSAKLNSSAPVKILNQSNGLLGYWSMDGVDLSTSTAFDRSGNGNNGTLNNAKAGIGKLGQALSFTGSASYLNIPNNSALNFPGSFNISFWVKPTVISTSMGIIDKKATDPSNGYVIYRDDIYPTKLNLRMRGTLNNYNYLPSAGTLDAGVWQHWSINYDSSTSILKYYKNGVLDTTYNTVNPGDLTSTAALQLAHSQTWNQYMKGSMDDVRLYNRALSATEIAKLAGAGTSKELKYDASSTAYFTASGLTNVTGRAQVDEFIKGLKSMGIWNSLSEVWLMRKNQNAPTGSTLYGLKNAYNGTYTGSTTMTTDGLVMADSNAGVNYSPNATVTFSAGGPSAMAIWNGLGNPSVVGDYYNYLMTSGGQLRHSLSSNVGGGTTWMQMIRDVKGSRWYNGSSNVSMTGNHMAGWNADTMHIFRDGVNMASSMDSIVTTTQTDGSYTLQSRGRTGSGAGAIRQSMLLFMPPGINLTDTQMNQIYKLYRNTAGYGLNLP